MQIARYDSLTHPMTEVMGIVAICLAMLAGAWLVLSRRDAPAGHPHERPAAGSARSLLLFYALLAGVADPLRKMSDVFSRLQAASAAADRIFARLDREPAVRDPQQPAPCPAAPAANWSSRTSASPISPASRCCKRSNLRIRFGETVAIVGPNGCGKSTLANLIPRFADPTGGRNPPRRRAAARHAAARPPRARSALVTQETLLFDDTIFNNIRYGAPHATREQVIAAAKQAHAHRFIESELPDGYETMAGALGGRLSGGQRQRIALARAILRDPAILILDEATSQVDLESEQAIQQVLEKFIRGRTTVIITHRLAVLSLADRIVVMQAGRIVDVGRHEELLARCALLPPAVPDPVRGSCGRRREADQGGRCQSDSQ